MQIQSLQSSVAAQSIGRTNSVKSAGPVQAAPAGGPIADQLDLSAEAQSLGDASRLGSTQATDGIRTEKVNAIRQSIASGSYESPEKLSGALDRLLDTFA